MCIALVLEKVCILLREKRVVHDRVAVSKKADHIYDLQDLLRQVGQTVHF